MDVKNSKCRFLAHLGVQHVTNKQRAAPLTFLPCTVDTHAYPVVDGAYVAVVLKVWKKCILFSNYPLSSTPPSARWSLRGKPAMLVPPAMPPTGMPPAFAQGGIAGGPTTPPG